MRWFNTNCILLVSFALISATKSEDTRGKRDLSLVKNFIKSAIFGSENKTEMAPNDEENIRIFRVPGFDNILVKVVPKVDGVVAVPENEHIIAVEDDIVEKPILFDGSICKDHEAHEIPIVVQRPVYWKGHPLLPIFPRPIPLPSILKPVNPVKVAVPELPPRYSYKQIHRDGSVTSYTSNDGQNVEVSESHHPVPLPPFVSNRIEEVVKLGAHGIQGVVTTPVIVDHVQKPMVQHFYLPNIYPEPPVDSSSSYFYKQIHNDGTATSYSSSQKSKNVVVTETGKVPTIPEFITDRIEKVAATAVTGKQPNIGVLSGSQVAQTYWQYPTLNVYPRIDIRGAATKVDNKEQQKMNVGSQSIYSYKTVHNDGTITNHKGESQSSTFIGSPYSRLYAKPISPAFIENRLQTIAKTSGGSFSYKIIHGDGSVTNYGVFGVHEGGNGGHKIVPLETTQNVQPNVQFTNEHPASSYSYKMIHNDGSVSSYSNTGIVEEKGTNKAEHKNNIEKNLHTNVNSIATNLKQENVKSENLNPPGGSFSYKAIHNDGSMTIHSQNGVQKVNGQQKEVNFDVKEDSEQSAKQNIHISEQSSANAAPSSFSYKLLHTDGSKTVYSQDGMDDKQQSINAVDVHEVKGSVSSGSYSYKAIHSDGTETNYSGNGVEEINKVSRDNVTTQKVVNLGEQQHKLSVDIDTSKSNYEHTNTNKVISPVPPLQELPVSPVNIYLRVSGKDEASGYTKEAENVDTISKDYVYIPPATTIVPPPIKTSVLQEKVQFGVQNPPSALVFTPIADVPCVEKSLSEHPIVVLDEPMKYSYEHRKIDGTAMTVESDQSAVWVKLSKKKELGKNRGDIP